ncbi:anti-sigma regulatory factor [Frigidibacter mobilis]|uniref:Anti-sigma regulatory factor n=1 Tax=Frigidibacter mobilis TaxID=1335048 RepID=A0A159ZAG7_9RHOB|nr:anti-sigma regulatory factor [Frigidibacter mobilis]
MGTEPAAGTSPGRQAALHLACPDTILRLELQADPVSVRQVLRRVRDRLAADLSEIAVGNLELVLAEMLNNIVKHAYLGKGGRIDLQIGAGPGCLLCRVTDQGIAMPGGVLPDRARLQPGLPVADLPECGFGWRMIRDLATDLQYRRETGWNVVQFRMALT